MPSGDRRSSSTVSNNHNNNVIVEVTNGCAAIEVSEEARERHKQSVNDNSVKDGLWSTADFGRNFSSLYTNAVSAEFQFAAALSGEKDATPDKLFVRELMAEPKAAAALPVSFLQLTISCQKDRMAALDRIFYLPAKLELVRQAHLRHMQKMLEHYESALEKISSSPGSFGLISPYFKPSSRKAEIDLEFLPTNLHLQRLQVRSSSSACILRNFDFFTTGAFTVISRHFKGGGLSSLKAKLIKALAKPLCIDVEQQEDVFDVWTQLRCLSQLRTRAGHVRTLIGEVKADAGQLLADNSTIEVDTTKAVDLFRQALEECWELLAELKEFARKLELQTTTNELYSHHLAYKQQQQKAATESQLPSQQKAVSVPPEDSNAATIVDDPTKRARSMSAGKNDAVVSSTAKATTAEQKTSTSSAGAVTNGKAAAVRKTASTDHQSGNAVEKHAPSGGFFSTFRGSVRRLSAGSAKIPAVNTDNFEVMPAGSFNTDLEARMSLFVIKVDMLAKSAPDLPQTLKRQWIADVEQVAVAAVEIIDRFWRTLSDAWHYRFILALHNASLTETYYLGEYRQNVASCQALIAITTGILHQLWTEEMQVLVPHILRPSFKLGLLLCFNSYLSCYRDEKGMLEDYAETLRFLTRRLLIRFVRLPSSSSPVSRLSIVPTVTGIPSSLTVTVPVSTEVFDALPQDVADGSRTLNVVPVLFSIGINEEATLGHNFGDSRLEHEINAASFAVFHNYVEFACEELQNAGCLGPRNVQIVKQLLADLAAEIVSPREKQYKNIDILHLVSQLCRLLKGVQFLSCKSGKDRTSMGVTLEEAYVLMRHYQLPEVSLQRTLDTLRFDGTRRQNVKKNMGAPYYAFSGFASRFLPELYKPPHGSYSGSVQT